MDNIKCANLRLTSILEEEEKEKRVESVFEGIVAKNSSNLKRETDIQAQEKMRVPNKLNQTDLHQRIFCRN